MMSFWGLGPDPWVPGPLGLLIAMEIFHDELLRILVPEPFNVTHLQGNIP